MNTINKNENKVTALAQTCYCSPEKNEKQTISIPVELTTTLFFDNKKIYTFNCLPQQLEELATGYLFARNFIKHKNEIREIVISNDKKNIHILSKNLINPINKISNTSCIYLKKSLVFNRMQEFEKISELYQHTRATHTVAFANANLIEVFCEDISRHAALDKLLGYCIKNEIAYYQCALLLSCRVTQSIAENIADKGISLILSLGGTTDSAIALCNEKKITLVGFIRNMKMHIFSNHGHIQI